MFVATVYVSRSVSSATAMTCLLKQCNDSVFSVDTLGVHFAVAAASLPLRSSFATVSAAARNDRGYANAAETCLSLAYKVIGITVVLCPRA